MRNMNYTLSRRKALQMALIVGGTACVQPIASLLAAETNRPPTFPNVLGPFYPVIKPMEKDADLTRIRGHKRGAEGKIIHLMGRVLNMKGEPQKGSRVEIWQANTHGRYSHPSDMNPAPLDPNFQGYGVQITDKEGRYRFKTIKPGGYPVTPDYARPPHIHFQVAGKKDLTVAQMFFPGEPLNAKDPLFQMLGPYTPGAIGQVMPPTADMEPDSVIVNWDITIFAS